jgi:excisionase family DNA binding protein
MAKKKAELIEKDIFTTYDAARICNANIASIKNWIAKGLLKAFRTPGGHYRIKRRDLQLFIQKYNMPNPFSDRFEKKVYLLDPEPEFLKKVAGALEDHVVSQYTDPIEAALCIGLDRPDLLVLEVELGAVNGEAFIDMIFNNPETKNIRIIVHTSLDDQVTIMRLRKKGVADIISKDASVKDLKAQLLDQIDA